MWWSGVRQRMALAVATGITVTLIAIVIFGSRGLLHLQTLTSEQDELNRRVALLLFAVVVSYVGNGFRIALVGWL